MTINNCSCWTVVDEIPLLCIFAVGIAVCSMEPRHTRVGTSDASTLLCGSGLCLKQWQEVFFNSFAPGNFEWNFRYLIFQIISVIDGWGISCELALRWMSLDLTDDKSTLVEVTARCRQATSHYLSQCWPRSLSLYGVRRPQWVNSSMILGWGLLNQFPPLLYFPNFHDYRNTGNLLTIMFIFDRCHHSSATEIWKWFKEPNRYFCKIIRTSVMAQSPPTALKPVTN